MPPFSRLGVVRVFGLPCRNLAAVRLVGLLGDDTLVNKASVAPVVLLHTLAVNRVHSVRDSSPEGATGKIPLPSEALGVEEQLPRGEGVVVLGLQRPLADERGELGRDGLEVGALAADGRGDVLRVGAGGGEVVDVAVDDQVLGGGEEGRPEVRALEVVLEHDGDALVEGLDLLEDTVHVGQDPVGAGVGETGGGAEAGEVSVGSLVDGAESECVLMPRVLEEFEDLVYGLEGVVEVGSVLEPVAVVESLTDVKAVDTTGQGVKADNDVHAILLDSVVGDGAKVLLLVASVELRARNLDPGGVGRRDTESVDTDGSKLVDRGGVQEGCIASLERRAALGTKVAAERPLVWGTGVERVEPLGVVGLLLGQPTAQVSTVGLVGLPVDVLGTADTRGPADDRAVTRRASRGGANGERALVMVLDDVAVGASGVGVEDNADLLEERVQARSGVADDSTNDIVDGVEDISQETGRRGCCGRRDQQSSGDGDLRTHDSRSGCIDAVGWW